MSPRAKYTGVCRFCGCSASEDESKACKTPTGDPCHWYDYERTVCTGVACIRAFGTERAKFKAERDRKRTPAEIHALICKRKRPASARKPA